MYTDEFHTFVFILWKRWIVFQMRCTADYSKLCLNASLQEFLNSTDIDVKQHFIVSIDDVLYRVFLSSLIFYIVAVVRQLTTLQRLTHQSKTYSKNKSNFSPCLLSTTVKLSCEFFFHSVGIFFFVKCVISCVSNVLFSIDLWPYFWRLLLATLCMQHRYVMVFWLDYYGKNRAVKAITEDKCEDIWALWFEICCWDFFVGGQFSGHSIISDKIYKYSMNKKQSK